MPEPIDSEESTTQESLRKLGSLLALPSEWSNGCAAAVLSLLEALVRILDLQVAYARIDVPGVLRGAEVAGSPTAGSLTATQISLLGRQLAPLVSAGHAIAPRWIKDPLGPGQFHVVPMGLGAAAEMGVVAVASSRPAFPTLAERLLLQVGVNQLVLELQRRRLNIQQQHSDEVERVQAQLRAENSYLREERYVEPQGGEIVGQSAALRRTLTLVERVAPTRACVLIQGETGTGKELIARAVHNASRRRHQPFIKLNCAAIPTGLLESELFGHERGAFTGAIARRAGRFELAQGTLFLDEVGEIPLELQAKLLRVLQEREFERLGGTRTLKADVRLVAASNRDLAAMVVAGQFRDDLYYRLRVFPVYVPPLRERVDDIPLLVHCFVERHCRSAHREILRIPEEIMTALCRYSWPGNIREMENFVERSVILSSGSVLEAPMSELNGGHVASRPQLTAAPAYMAMATPTPLPALPSLTPTPTPLPAGIATLEAAEREVIIQALEASSWVIAGPMGAAARLGVKRTSLQYKMQKLGISRRR